MQDRLEFLQVSARSNFGNDIRVQQPVTTARFDTVRSTESRNDFIDRLSAIHANQYQPELIASQRPTKSLV
jgi:hypothetical protein